MRRIRVLLSAVVLILVPGGCTSEKAQLAPSPTAPVEAKTPSFIPPTAERKHTDCKTTAPDAVKQFYVRIL